MQRWSFKLSTRSYLKFISVMRIFWVHEKFLMKRKHYLVYACIWRIFKIKVCGFSINVKIKFHSNLKKQNIYKKFYTQCLKIKTDKNCELQLCPLCPFSLRYPCRPTRLNYRRPTLIGLGSGSQFNIPPVDKEEQ